MFWTLVKYVLKYKQIAAILSIENGELECKLPFIQVMGSGSFWKAKVKYHNVHTMIFAFRKVICKCWRRTVLQRKKEVDLEQGRWNGLDKKIFLNTGRLEQALKKKRKRWQCPNRNDCKVKLKIFNSVTECGSVWSVAKKMNGDECTKWKATTYWADTKKERIPSWEVSIGFRPTLGYLTAC